MKKILWPTYTGLVLCFIYVFITPCGFFEKVIFPKTDFFSNASLTSSITILGFLIAVITFIISASDAPVMQYIINQNGDKQLWQYFLQPFISGLLCIVSSVLLSILVDSNNEIIKFALVLFVFANIVLLFSVIQTTKMIIRILKQIVKDKKKNKPVEKRSEDEFFQKAK